MSEEEARDRLIAAGEALVAETGLTVGLDHLRFEEVIARSGVPRSTAYRTWPSKDDYYVELMCHLAGPSWAGTAAFDEATIAVATEVIMGRIHKFHDPAERRAAVLEACRRGAEQNFKTLCSSPDWRTYVALNGAAMSMVEGTTRDRLVKALQDAEGGFVARMQGFYERMCSIVGVRMRPEYNGDFGKLAAVGAAVVEGLGLRNFLNPEILAERYERTKFSDEGITDWSLPAIGFTAILDALTEPDPDWTPERLKDLPAVTS